ncbi:hypothetical protein NET03_00295 [Thermomicrobium sp. CFH 73360]|uniref:hypothetical protein n=1 Tax=Thermomicrobium sp. CFH 73360 TaxID=2951987 RepID=UPI002076983E|nr:hypothetical protein [Thermomicrobium sp. CFH 73360]MCM8744963.1 hypothetical protein [Thermomicrobium sp. CFH 73360]
MRAVLGRVPIELGIVAAERAFRTVLGREVRFATANRRETADRILHATWEVYSTYLQGYQWKKGCHPSRTREERERLMQAVTAFFLGVAVLESLYEIDMLARWLVGEFDFEELSA